MILVLLSLSFFDQCVNLAWMAGCCFSQAVTFFSQHQYSFYWRSWDQSRDQCKMYQAALVVIESQEEQVSQISFV